MRENIKEGSVLKSPGVDFHFKVLGVCGSIVFVNQVKEGKFGPPEFYDIEDLTTWGWKLTDEQ